MKKILPNILLLFASIAVGLLFVEIFLRLTPFVEFADKKNQYVFYSFDPVLGWNNTPNTTGTFAREDFSTSVKINSWGMRDKEISLKGPEGIRRVAVVGDSFTWGHGVEEEERFSDIAAQHLNSLKLEILNFGVSGFGPLEYLLEMDHVLQFNPKLVVLVFCLENDWQDNVLRQRYGYYGPYATLENDKLSILGYPIPNCKKFGATYFGDSPLHRFLNSYSKIYALCRGFINSRYLTKNQEGLIGFNSLDIYNLASPLREKAIAINQRILEGIRDKLKEKNIPLVLLLAPTKCDLKAEAPNLIPTAAKDAILHTAAHLQIPILDPTDALSLADFFPHDSHWNKSGHAKVAPFFEQAVKQYLP